jgi:hypothetical protein
MVLYKLCVLKNWDILPASDITLVNLLNNVEKKFKLCLLNKYVSSLPTYSIVIGKEKIKTWLPLIIGTLYTLYDWWAYLDVYHIKNALLI